MSSLIACVACARHFKRVDAACPHCGAAAPIVGGGVLKTATALLMGLGLTGCVEALYGVPTTESDSSGGTDATTTAGTTEDTAMTESGSGTSAGTSGSAGTTAATTTASTTSMTTAEPDYGVPATSGILPRP